MLAWGELCLQGDSVSDWTRGEPLIVLGWSSGDKREGVIDASIDEVSFRQSLFSTPRQKEDVLCRAPPKSLPSNSGEELDIALSI